MFRRTWSRATPVKRTLSRKKKFCRINHKVEFTRFHGIFGKVSCESCYHIFAFLLASSIAWCTVWLLLKHANATTDITFYYSFIYPHPHLLTAWRCLTKSDFDVLYVHNTTIERSGFSKSLRISKCTHQTIFCYESCSSWHGYVNLYCVHTVLSIEFEWEYLATSGIGAFMVSG